MESEVKQCKGCTYYDYDQSEDLHLCLIEELEGIQLPAAKDCPHYEEWIPYSEVFSASSQAYREINNAT